MAPVGYGGRVRWDPGSAADDVLHLLERDHADVRRLFGMFDGQAPDIAGELFWILTDDLVRHEVAEELVVYPALGPDPGTAAGEGLAEQAAIEERLARMEGMPTTGAEFRQELEALRHAVDEHVEREERDLVPLLRRTLLEDRRRELGRRYAEVKETAPHRRGPGTAGSTIVGRVPALAEWIRDSARKDLWQAG